MPVSFEQVPLLHLHSLRAQPFRMPHILCQYPWLLSWIDWGYLSYHILSGTASGMQPLARSRCELTRDRSGPRTYAIETRNMSIWVWKTNSCHREHKRGRLVRIRCDRTPVKSAIGLKAAGDRRGVSKVRPSCSRERLGRTADTPTSLGP